MQKRKNAKRRNANAQERKPAAVLVTLPDRAAFPRSRVFVLAFSRSASGVSAAEPAVLVERVVRVVRGAQRPGV
jgi:hypothetical protein